MLKSITDLIKSLNVKIFIVAVVLALILIVLVIKAITIRQRKMRELRELNLRIEPLEEESLTAFEDISLRESLAPSVPTASPVPVSTPSPRDKPTRFIHLSEGDHPELNRILNEFYDYEPGKRKEAEGEFYEYFNMLITNTP